MSEAVCTKWTRTAEQVSPFCAWLLDLSTVFRLKTLLEKFDWSSHYSSRRSNAMAASASAVGLMALFRGNNQGSWAVWVYRDWSQFAGPINHAYTRQ